MSCREDGGECPNGRDSHLGFSPQSLDWFESYGACRSRSAYTKTPIAPPPRHHPSYISPHAVQVELLTGRTHQIRGQLAAEGCPIYGDLLYGPSQQPNAASDATAAATASAPASAEAAASASASASASNPAGPTGGGSSFVLRRVPPQPPSSSSSSLAADQRTHQTQRAFVDSPKLALQACHVSLEFEGRGGEREQHSHTLGRDTCWWVRLGTTRG